MAINTPWSYKKGASPLHRLPAGPKLIFLLLLSLAAFFPGTGNRGLFLLFGIALAIIVLSCIAGIAPWKLLRGSGPLLFMILGVFALRGIEFSPPGFNAEGIRETAIFSARITAAFAAGSLLFAVTTTTEIRKSATRFEAALGLKTFKPGLGLSLMLGFLKSFFEIWEDINLAWKSRNGRNNPRRLVILIPLALEKMMIKAAETASAMESRGMADFD